MLNLLKKRNKSNTGFSLGSNESPSLVHRKQRLQRFFTLLMFIVLVGSITDISTFKTSKEEFDVDSEAVPSQNIVAKFTFDSENLAATHEAEEQAAVQVPNTWRIDTRRVEDQLKNLDLGITILATHTKTVEDAITEALLNSTSDQLVESIVENTVRELAVEWKSESLAKDFPDVNEIITWISPDITTLPNREFEPDDESNPKTSRAVLALEQSEDSAIEFRNLEPLKELSAQGLEYVLTMGILEQDRALLNDNAQASMKLNIERSREFRDLPVFNDPLISEVPDTLKAQDLLKDHMQILAEELQGQYESSFADWELLIEAAFSLAKIGLTDTLILDDVRTEVSRERARQAVEPIMKSIKAGIKIQEANEEWTEQSRHDMKTYSKLLNDVSDQPGNLLGPVAANMVFVALLLMALQRAIIVLEQKRIYAFKSMNVMLLIIGGTVILGRVMLVFDSTGLLIPMTASAVLLTILTNARLASIASLVIAVMLSIQYGQDWRLFMITSAMSITGIISIHRVRKRHDIAAAVLKATIVGALLVLATTLSTETWVGIETLYSIAIIAFNGLICTLVIPGLLPPLEKLFGITTDIQLLEYSDLNNEVLNRLAIKVPATYAHSLMMGQMAEAACDAIGANGLLARVCAYYHDIGKLRRPEYFSENQTGYNIHDDLSPRLSARAIASHVTEGVELAREHHLPQPIIRGILEHHGNSLISFFYVQALEQQKHGDVREEDFRYPGPKPQSRETGILMICDAVESGVRTIKNPNEDRVREFIDKIIQSRSNDRQFDECDLTLKQLDVIGNVLTKIVCSTHHSRVSYPEKPEQEEATNVIHITSGGRN